MPQLARHQRSKKCKDAQTWISNREREASAQAAQNDIFTIDGEEIEKVKQFRYLGRPILQNDSDYGAIRYNIAKAQGKCRMFSRILAREGAKPKVMGKFYKAVVQSVLLYGSETWCLTLSQYDTLNAFHVSAARRISGLHFEFNPVTESGNRPAAARALDRAGLLPLITYLRRRRTSILPYAQSLRMFRLVKERRVIQETAGKIFYTDDPDLRIMEEKLVARNRQLVEAQLEAGTG
jgi:hypothetical protein